jgi:hypothetical protein
MATDNKLEFDAATNQSVVRELTEAEQTQRAKDIAKANDLRDSIQSELSAKQSARTKLAALGLTEAEIKALVG